MAEPLNVGVEQDAEGRWYVEFPIDCGTAWLLCKNEKAARHLANVMKECVK